MFFVNKNKFMKLQLFVFQVKQNLNSQSLLKADKKIKQMYRFEIRFADTGYPHKYQNISSIQMIQQLIYKEYKIQKNNQKFITKKGHIVTTNDKLNNQNLLKKTFTAGLNSNLHQQMSQVFGMYVFNHKELLKMESQDRMEFIQEQGRGILRKRYETCRGLRPKIYELQPLSTKFTNQEMIKILAYNQSSLVPLANQWHGSTKQLINLWETFKQNQECLDQYIGRWENQRKALMALSKNLQILCDEKKTFYQKLHNCLKAAKDRLKTSQANSNQQNSESSIIPRYSNDKNKVLFQQTNVLQTKILTSISTPLALIAKKCGLFRKNIKSSHIQLQKQIKKIDEEKRRKSNQLQKIFTQMKQVYSNLIEGIRQKLQRGNDSKLITILAQKKNAQKKYEDYLKFGVQSINQMQNKFTKIYGHYVNHGKIVRIQYRRYHEIFCEIQDNLKNNCVIIQSQLQNLHKQIDQNFKNLQQSQSQQVQLIRVQIPNNNSPVNNKSNLQSSLPRLSSQIPAFELQQQQQRYNFNTKLIALSEQIKQILKQQEQRRIKYVQQILLIDDMYNNEILTNTKVPCLLINYDQCTDRQITNKSRSFNLGKQNIGNFYNFDEFSKIDIDLYKSDKGMDRILKQLQFLKSCYNTLKSSPQSSKITSLQLLLQKSSDIFHHIYSNKLSLLQKLHTQQQKNHLNRISTLQQQTRQLQNKIYTYTQSQVQIEQQNQIIQKQYKKQIENMVKQLAILKKDNKIKENQIQQLFKQRDSSSKELESKNKKYEILLQQNKKQINKLKKDKRQMQERITKQVSGTMETLLAQLQRTTKLIKQLQQVNHEYKIVMGDQAVRIATLQTQLLMYKKQQQQINQNNDNNLQSSLQNSFYGNKIQPNKNPQISSSNFSSCQQPTLTYNKPQCQKQIISYQLSQLQKQIKKLQKLIQQLKQQNQQLKQQNYNLNQEILKIAIKDVEDIEIQTQQQYIYTINDQHNKKMMCMSIKQSEKQYDKLLYRNKQEQQYQQYKQISNSIYPNINITNNNTNIVTAQQIKINEIPQVGQLRIFIPFSPGLYIAVRSTPSGLANRPAALSALNLTSQTRNYINIHQTQFNLYNNSQQERNWPYILDMNCLSSKARQLLTQCTLVIILKINKIMLGCQGSQRYYIQGDITAAIGFQDQDLITKDYAPFLK